MDLLYILGYYSTACVYFSFRWGPFVRFPRDCTVELH